jgi:hypothetical protein
MPRIFVNRPQQPSDVTRIVKRCVMLGLFADQRHAQISRRIKLGTACNDGVPEHAGGKGAGALGRFMFPLLFDVLEN